MIVKHMEPTNNPCPFCAAVFQNKYQLNDHIRKCNDKQELVVFMFYDFEKTVRKTG